jgi:hypothetical protein
VKGSRLNYNGCRIQAKPVEIILNNIKSETSRSFRNKNGEYLKKKLMSLKETIITNISEICIEA